MVGHVRLHVLGQAGNAGEETDAAGFDLGIGVVEPERGREGERVGQLP